MRNWRNVEIIEVKDGENGPGRAERLALEATRLLARLDDRDRPVVLDERGAALTSGKFAGYIRASDESAQKRIVFIVGGPAGLAPQIHSRASLLLSLSPMTLPHEMARIVLLEQIFRAESILGKFPYHI